EFLDEEFSDDLSFLFESYASPEDGELHRQVDLSETPLWLAIREVARPAELMEAADRLAAQGDANATVLARAELVQCLHDLGELAPVRTDDALDQLAADLRRGRPHIR